MKESRSNTYKIGLECYSYKIWAIGYKRYVFVEILGEKFCYRIDNEFYQELKSHGVPTAQSFRKKIDKNG